MTTINKIVVLTSGGDAPGMNAAIRAVTRVGHYYGIEMMGCRSGYHGLLNDDIFTLQPQSVANIIQRGGTILKTDRLASFHHSKTRAKCIAHLKQRGIKGIIVIGGDGSFKGASLLQQEGQLLVIGIPATIDNDITGTDYTIGFDTATNTALQAIDKIRDTACSHDRHFLVEVMGRHSGFLAIQVGIAGGAEFILTPEWPLRLDKIVHRAIKPPRHKQSMIIVVAEGDDKPGRSVEIAKQLKQQSQLEFKVCILGHMQRGGSPSAYDRSIASRFGALAIEALRTKQSQLMTAIVNNTLKLAPFPDHHVKKQATTGKNLLTLNEMLAI